MASARQMNDTGAVLSDGGFSQNGQLTLFDDHTSEWLIDNARAINNSGVITGSMRKRVFADPPYHAFVWQTGTITQLPQYPDYPASIGFGINDAGTVVGYGFKASGEEKAFLWSGGALSDLGISPALSSNATAINNAGQVVGYTFTSKGINDRAFVWQNGTRTDINPPSGMAYIQGWGISSNGILVGRTGPSNAFFKGSRAFTWQNGQVTLLPDLPTAESSITRSVNKDGLAVGQSASRGAFWKNGQAYDLNAIVSNRGDWLIVDAVDINDDGRILAFGSNNIGDSRAFILTPR
jgi:probable HAF family extracellular repeat protein